MAKVESKTNTFSEKLKKLNTLIEGGNLKSVQKFLRKAKITGQTYEEFQRNTTGSDIKAPIETAASAGEAAMLDLLVEKGFDPSGSCSTDGQCALHLACRAGRLGSVETLIEKHQVDVNAVNTNGSTPLFIAAENGHVDVVKYLVENGADLEYVDEHQRTVLHAAANTSADLCDYLLSEGVEVNVENIEGNTALHLAFEGENTDVVRVLVEYGADIHYVNEYSNCPLMGALDNKDFEMFQIMCSGDPESLDSNDSSALHHAVAHSLVEYVRHLVVELGVQLGGENMQCETPFSLAMDTGNLAIAQMLIRAGLNPAEEACLQDDAKMESILKVDGGAEFIQHVKYLATNPRSLQDITCFRIRALLGRNPELAETLPLPQHLKDVVMLKKV